MTFEEGPAVRRTVQNSLLNIHLGNVVNRQVREMKTYTEVEEGRVDTKRHMENKRGQAESGKRERGRHLRLR